MDLSSVHRLDERRAARPAASRTSIASSSAGSRQRIEDWDVDVLSRGVVQRHDPTRHIVAVFS
jgi:hypothetical protein